MISITCHFVKYTLQMVKRAVPPGAMHRAVREVDPTVPTVHLTTVDAILAGTLANRRSYAVAVWPRRCGPRVRCGDSRSPPS